MLIRASAAFSALCPFVSVASLVSVLPHAAFAQTGKTTAPVSPPTRLDTVTVGRTTVAWTPASGLSVVVDGVPVVLQSSLNISKQGWTGTLLDQNKPADLQNVAPWADAPNGGKTARVNLENANAACIYTFTIAPDSNGGQTVDVTLTYRLKADVPAQIEYGAAYLSGPVVQGSVLTGGANNEAQTTREIPVTIPLFTQTQEQNRLLPPFDIVKFATRLGELTVRYEGNAPRPVIFDARGEIQAWARAFPVFWLGIGSEAPKLSTADGEQRARFRFTVGPAPNTTLAPPLTGTLSRGTRLPNAYAPVLPAAPRVIPRPKKLTVPASSSPFRITPRTVLVTDRSTTAGYAARIVQGAIKERFGFTPHIVNGPNAIAGGPREHIYLGVAGKSTPLAANALSTPAQPEGYAVHVDKGGVLVAGHDDAGVIWGAQTLVQLLDADTTGPIARAALVQDWPTLRVRAMHLFTGKNAAPFHYKLLSRIYSPFKINTLFIQAEQARWNADPAVAPIWGASTEQLKEEVDLARELGITVYPLLQSYGHMEWLFNKPQNRAFAEDPDTPYAVNFTNPEAVRYLEKFNDEADRLFNAPGFHVGLDEVTMRGRFPYRSAPRTFADLFVANARHWHTFFTKRGKQMWMWADMALHPSEVKPSFGTAPTPEDAAKVRAGLPKDIVMVDWQYTPYPTYPSLRKLKDAGFKKVVAATWFQGENIRLFSRDAARVGALGAMQTTWAGYESNESVLSGPQRKQFTAMVLAAEYFWNGGEGPSADKLPYDYAEVFARAYAGPNPTDYKTRPGYTLRLGNLANRSLPDFLGYGKDSAPLNLPPGDTRALDGTRFHFGAGTLVLVGKLNAPSTMHPNSAALDLAPGERTEAYREVRLLLTATHQTQNGERIGTLHARLASGKTVEVPLIYGRNIASWEDGQSLETAPVAYRGTTRANQPFLLRRLNVTAPTGDTIVGINLESVNGSSAPALFAATVFP